MCCCCDFWDFAVFIANKLYHLLTQWPFVVLIMFYFIRKPISNLISKANSIKMTKTGLEIQQLIENAQNVITDTSLLATSIYIPLLDMLARTNGFESAYSIKDKLNTRNAIQKYIKDYKICNELLNEKISSLNDSILSDVLYSTIKCSDGYTLSDEILIDMLNQDTQSQNYKCNPDIDKIEEFLKKEKLMEKQYIQCIFEEAKYFQVNKNFQDIDKLIECMNISINDLKKY